MRISAVIITRNEENNIARCLRSLSFCDEVVVVDSGSTDRTREIASELGARVVEQPWLGFGPQKRRGVELATYDWILNLDADEWLTEDLQTELKNLIEDPRFAAYEMGMHDIFLGRPLVKWGVRANRLIRLFDRRRANFNTAPVHERVEFPGTPGRLKGIINHQSYRDLHQYFEKFNDYTSLAAKQSRSLPPMRLRLDAVLRWPFKFFGMYFVQGYFVCGWAGFVWCWLSSSYGVVKRMKQLEAL